MLFGSFTSFLVFLTLPLNIAGAKEAHAVSPHFAQIMYFGLVSALFAAPPHFTRGHALDLFQSFWKNRLLGFSLGFLALIAGLLSVHFFRLVQTTNDRLIPDYLT